MAQRIILSLMTALLVWPVAPCLAQEAPAPHKQPLVPVSRQALSTSHQTAPVSRDIVGQALILDGEKLRIGNVEMRLFGVVPPQLSANFGPQARSALDAVAAGNAMHCQIRDRDHDGNFLATCHNASNLDAALELLKRGLAVAARGSLADTELATPYITAEQYAQTQKLGLWSITLTPSTSVTVAPAPVAVPEVAKVEPPVTKADVAAPLSVPAAPSPPVDLKKDKAEKTTAVPVVAVNAGVAASPKVDTPNFFARYQLLLTGLVMLVTALSILGVLVVQRRLERREELRALAAALRGELMAARALCQGRLKAIMTEYDDRHMAWPRIRSTLYQAYVGRIGWLGAELARQIASLYGQSNDYAAYYQPAEAARAGDLPKRHALQTMMQHIEEVLPKLALIEETGKRLPIRPMTSLTSSRPVQHQPIELESTPLPVASLAAPIASSSVTSAPASSPTTSSAPTSSVSSSPSVSSSVSPSLSSSVSSVTTDVKKTETSTVSSSPKSAPSSEKTETLSSPKTPSAEVKTAQDKPKETAREAVASLTNLTKPAQNSGAASPSSVAAKPVDLKTADLKPVEPRPVVTEAARSAAQAVPPPAIKKDEPKPLDSKTAATKPAESKANDQAPPTHAVPLWDAVRKFARDHLPEKSAPLEEALPDYAALIEEDMSNFTFGESDYDFYDENLDEPMPKFSGHGRS